MRIILIISATLIFNITFSQKIVFESTKHNFGYLQKGEIDTMVYKFKNEGDSPLVISSTKVECSCTKVEFPTDPIAPGSGGEFKVIFDSKGAIGYQDRAVTIISNSKKGDSKIHFKGDVIAKKKMGF
ncbi:MAG: DUF1573 domain-containing protein [Bacteroidota bacterium]|jgi:hypothetical protein